MKSPRFEMRATRLQRIFTPANLEFVWSKKVRISMRQQFLNDGIEDFDFHTSRKLECQKLSHSILSGSYVPEQSQRILVEKSKGLCRQLVIPSIRDAIVLQCLSDELYNEIKDKAPTDRSFFEPKQHQFNSQRSNYGTFASWLNFQKELFKFTKDRNYIVVTDIANYYDNISYTHLRNAISSITSADECVLDMLIYVLSSLLWQPDYTPRTEVGLPQINLDAPRLLAHCFLYELDEYLAQNSDRDFVRYMDDIDIGVDNIVEAKLALRDVDLVLQTKQIRLNSGKTKILTRTEAEKHFRIIDNARLDKIRDRVSRRLKNGLSTDRDKKLIELRISNGIKRKIFDDGNGEKILKRWIGLAGQVNALISPRNLEQIIRIRPGCRETALAYIRRTPLTSARARLLCDCVLSGLLVDDAAIVDISNHIVETKITTTSGIREHLSGIISAMDIGYYYSLYCKIWLESEYATNTDILKTLNDSQITWISDMRLGRLVGGLAPLFRNSPEAGDYERLISTSHNTGANAALEFHTSLSSDLQMFAKMFDALKMPNPSRGTGITHAKFLCLMSALTNTAARPHDKATLRANNAAAFDDLYYRRIARRLGAL